MDPYTIAKKVVQKIVHHGYIAYFAGGFVRDRLLNHPSDDIDIATDAPTEKIISLFKKTIPVGVNYGIVIVVEGGHHFEVATFRKEEGYKDGRRPDHIERATPKEDAMRRDFTINGLFFDPLHGTIYDFVGGQDDLKKKTIRAIGNPHNRFLEDRLRMIRAIRYAARFHFVIEEETEKAIFSHAQDLFPAVAIERVVQEFKKMARFSNFPHALAELHRFNLLPQIFPSLRSLTIYEIQQHLKYLPKFPKETPLIIQLLELFPHYTLEEKLQLCEELKLSNEEKKWVEELNAWSHIDHCDDFDLTCLYATTHSQLWLQIVALHRQDCAKFLTFHHEKMRVLAPAIERRKQGKILVTAAHLIERGIHPGPAMGELLKNAERLATNRTLNTPDEVLALILKSM